MSVLDKGKKRFFLMYDLAREFPWRRAIKLHDSGADLVVWIHHASPKPWWKYLLRGDFILKDAGLVAALVDAKIPYRIVTGAKVEALHDERIVYSIFEYNPKRRRNYSAGLVEALRGIEARGNTLYPSADEAEWWENKVFMHERFEELGVRCPATVLDRVADDLHVEKFEFPLLVKEPHSQGSAGLHKVENAEALRRLRAEFRSHGEPEVLIQELLDMSRDLRVTMVGDKIVHHYFRINTTEEWQPTSTRRGSLVDFQTFPEQWRDHIISTFAKLGMHTGAFDICWEGDDLETEPIFLEVSPAYTPNPPPSAAFSGQPYYAFKKQLTGADSFGTAFVRIVFDIQRMVLSEWNLSAS